MKINLSFLDVKIKKVHHGSNTKFLLSIFRKMTFTGLSMNFHSYTFTNFKLNNIKTLLHRPPQYPTRCRREGA